MGQRRDLLNRYLVPRRHLHSRADGPVRPATNLGESSSKDEGMSSVRRRFRSGAARGRTPGTLARRGTSCPSRQTSNRLSPDAVERKSRFPSRFLFIPPEMSILSVPSLRSSSASSDVVYTVWTHSQSIQRRSSRRTRF